MAIDHAIASNTSAPTAPAAGDPAAQRAQLHAAACTLGAIPRRARRQYRAISNGSPDRWIGGSPDGLLFAFDLINLPALRPGSQ